jgi:hypothetical protein
LEDIKQSIENSNLIYAAVRNFTNPVLKSDGAANDSDKTITVPSGKIWEIISIWIELVTTADAGNRQMQIDIRDDGDDVIYSLLAKNVQVASQTEHYACSQNGQEPAETVAGKHFIPIPVGLMLPAGYNVRIYDSAAIAAAADDMVIQMIVNQYDVS